MDRMDIYKQLLEGEINSTEAAAESKKLNEAFPDFLKKKKDGDKDGDDKSKKKDKKKDGDDDDDDKKKKKKGGKPDFLKKAEDK